MPNRDKNSSIKKQHPDLSRRASHSYTGATYTYADYTLPSAVEPTPRDQYDELVEESANWSIGPVLPGEGEEFTEIKRRVYLEYVARTGLIYRAASVLNVEYDAVEAARRQDPIFNRCVEQALAHYGERVQQALASRALYGYLEPHFDDRGNIVGMVRKFDHKLLLQEAKRTNNAYEQPNSTSAKKAGLPTRAPTAQVWYNKYSGIK